jgi:ERCC4-related helicase
MNTKGQTQKQQQAIVAKFRAGDCNVLVATCIAEEGIVSITEKKM